MSMQSYLYAQQQMEGYDPEDDVPKQPRCQGCASFLPWKPNATWKQVTFRWEYDTYKNIEEDGIGELDTHVLEAEEVTNVEGWTCKRCGWTQECGPVGKPEKIVYNPPIVSDWRPINPPTVLDYRPMGKGGYEAVLREK